MIRVSCPQCGKAFKASGEEAGRPVVCPRCGELSVAPASAAGRDEPARRPPLKESQPSRAWFRGLFRGMSTRVRWAVALTAGVVAGSLLFAGDWGVPLAVCSAVVLLAILHGHATGCPACGKWWSRAQLDRRLVAREGFDEAGVPFERSLEQTTYQCASCGHRWSVTDADEEGGPCRARPQRHGG
jgi:DNA-directed RNA polymerase subunit RPC12/RpoP